MDRSRSADTAEERQAQAGVPSAAEAIREAIIESLRSVFDPEIPVNVYELGLIYDVTVDGEGRAGIRMTLTSPFCPAAALLPAEVEARARAVPGVTSVELELVWDPPWSPERMSDAARLDLGLL